MTPKKLQKILYYTYAWGLVFFNDSSDSIDNKVFDGKFEAWVHGPVDNEVYAYYATYGYHEIEKISTEVTVKNKDALGLLNQVWSIYGSFDGNQLERLTHQEEPWINARGDAKPLDSLTRGFQIRICLNIMAKSKRHKIPKIDIQTLNIIPKPKLFDSEFRFVSVYEWLHTTGSLYKKYGFSNTLKDAAEYVRFVTELIEEVIPKINSEHSEIFDYYNHSQQYKHCHRIKDKELAIVREVSKVLLGQDFASITANDDNDYSWWQLGFIQPTRIIGILSKNDHCFYPIFVDWHHLIYPNEKHNQFDYGNYSFDPYC